MKFFKNKYLTIFFLIFFALFIVLPVLALEVQYPTVPGATAPSGNNPQQALPEYVNYLFGLAVYIIGFVFIGSLIIGGWKYFTSAGNAAKTLDAREQISSAFFGLTLLLASYILLYTINPNLVNLTLPKLKTTAIEQLPEGEKPPSIVYNSLIGTEIPYGKIIEERIFDSKKSREDKKKRQEEEVDPLYKDGTPRMERITQIADNFSQLADKLLEQSQQLVEKSGECACGETQPCCEADLSKKNNDVFLANITKIWDVNILNYTQNEHTVVLTAAEVSKNIITVYNQEQFNQAVIEGSKKGTVLVDFGNVHSCPGCIASQPYVNALADNPNKYGVTVVHVPTMDAAGNRLNQDLVSKYGANQWPTFQMYQDGHRVTLGANGPSQLQGSLGNPANKSVMDDAISTVAPKEPTVPQQPTTPTQPTKEQPLEDLNQSSQQPHEQTLANGDKIVCDGNSCKIVPKDSTGIDGLSPSQQTPEQFEAEQAKNFNPDDDPFEQSLSSDPDSIFYDPNSDYYNPDMDSSLWDDPASPNLNDENLFEQSLSSDPDSIFYDPNSDYYNPDMDSSLWGDSDYSFGDSDLPSNYDQWDLGYNNGQSSDLGSSDLPSNYDQWDLGYNNGIDQSQNLPSDYNQWDLGYNNGSLSNSGSNWQDNLQIDPNYDYHFDTPYHENWGGVPEQSSPNGLYDLQNGGQYLGSDPNQGLTGNSWDNGVQEWDYSKTDAQNFTDQGWTRNDTGSPCGPGGCGGNSDQYAWNDQGGNGQQYSDQYGNQNGSQYGDQNQMGDQNQQMPYNPNQGGNQNNQNGQPAENQNQQQQNQQQQKNTTGNASCPDNSCTSKPGCTCDPCKSVRKDIQETEKKNFEAIYMGTEVSQNSDSGSGQQKTSFKDEQKKATEEIRLIKNEIDKLERAEDFMLKCPLNSLMNVSAFNEFKDQQIGKGWLAFSSTYWKNILVYHDWGTFYCPVSGTMYENGSAQQQGSFLNNSVLTGSLAQKSFDKVELAQTLAQGSSGLTSTGSLFSCSVEMPLGEIFDRAKKQGYKITERLEKLISLSEELSKQVDELHVLVSQCSSRGPSADPQRGGCFSVCHPTALGVCVKFCTGSPCPTGAIAQKMVEINNTVKGISNQESDENTKKQKEGIKDVVDGKKKSKDLSKDAEAREQIGLKTIIKDVVPQLITDLEESRVSMQKCSEGKITGASTAISCSNAVSGIAPGGMQIKQCVRTEDWFQKCLTRCYLEKGLKDYTKCLMECQKEEADNSGIPEKAYSFHEINFYCCQAAN